MRLLKAMIWPCARPASFTRSVAPLATRKSLTRSSTCAAVIGGGGPGRGRGKNCPAVGLFGSYCPRTCASSRRLGGGSKSTGTTTGRPTRTIRSTDAVLLAVEERGQLFRRRALGQAHLVRRRRDGAVGARRPGEHLDRELRLHRRHDVRGDVVVGPARVAEAPGLEVAVGESPRLHRLDGPFAGGLQARRAGEPRAVDVGQEVERAHDLGMRVLFLADPDGDVRSRTIGGGDRRHENRERERGRQTLEHGRLSSWNAGHLTLTPTNCRAPTS